MSAALLTLNENKPFLNIRSTNVQADGNLLVIGNADIRGNLTVDGSTVYIGPVVVAGPLECTELVTNIISPTAVTGISLNILSNGGANDYVNVEMTDGILVNQITAPNILTLTSNTGSGEIHSNYIFKCDEISSRSTNSDLTLEANGSGVIRAASDLYPETNGSNNLGVSGIAWNNAYAENVYCNSLNALSSGTIYVLNATSLNVLGNLEADNLSAYHTNSDLQLSGNGSGKINVRSTIYPSVTSTDDIGTSSNYFNNAYINNLTLATGMVISGASGIQTDLITSYSTNHDLELTANGSGKIKVDKTVYPSVTSTDDIGTSSNYFNNAYINNVTFATGGAALNLYDSGTSFNLGYTGAISGTDSFTAMKIGRLCCLHIPGVSAAGATGTANISFAALPTRYRPTINGLYFEYMAFNNATRTPAVLTIDNTTGVIVLYGSVSQGGFTGTGLCGLLGDIELTYIA